ncbi:transcriptional coactivator PipX [Oscillatoria sp. FACHB-1406]|uniref:transcriptional coactivator PipX n=1 Tax=Oscillatoria sp. FACHB-1406 TaxID=2692846 RepID=UPI0016870C48|nr:PipX family protein [Oscillatoria sp. FACHB-1406]MBD2577099.1 PipX family protein [Oscillatoria sp. FACHB-1406]
MENNESYLNHPTFGLLYKICSVEANQELFTTLYAQRLFFLVTSSTNGVSFAPIGRSDARLLVENRMRQLRRLGSLSEYAELQGIHRKTWI